MTQLSLGREPFRAAPASAALCFESYDPVGEIRLEPEGKTSIDAGVGECILANRSVPVCDGVRWVEGGDGPDRRNGPMFEAEMVEGWHHR